MRRSSLSTPLGRFLGISAVGALLLASLGCGMTPGTGPGPAPVPGPGSTSLPIAADIVVLDDPTATRGASAISCTFEAMQIGTDGNLPIQIRVDWAAPCGTHKSETFTFRGGEQAFTSTYEDPTGYPISMTFWASISWTDSRGKHIVRSASAVPGA